MRAIDTHAHLDFSEFDQDREAVISSLEKEQIGVINVATDEASNEAVDSLSQKNRLVWGALGLHPSEIDDQALTKLPQNMEKWGHLLSNNDKIVAIGEVGLDYYRPAGGEPGEQSANRQKTALRQFLTFAQEKNLPVIFHCRQAYGDLASLLSDYQGLEGVVHCFSGTMAQAKLFLDLGLHLSFTANITYAQNTDLLAVAVQIPEESMLLETDSPFLPPQGKRGQRNTPASVIDIAQTLADSRNISLEKILSFTSENAKKLFKMEE